MNAVGAVHHGIDHGLTKDPGGNEREVLAVDLIGLERECLGEVIENGVYRPSD